MRRIVFVGTCQARAIASIYAEFIQPVTRDNIIELSSVNPLTPTTEHHLQSADIIIEQVFDREYAFSVKGMALKAEVIQFPLLSAQFLWPFGQARHPRNRAIPYRASGPFAGCDTDNAMNKLLRKGLDADAAVKAYLALDIPKLVNLSRFFEITMEQQRKRDQICGTDFTTLIEQRFREEQCFCSGMHPALPIIRPLLVYLLTHMGILDSLVKEVVASITRTVFSLAETPIHPAVADHFRLQFYNLERRYARFTGEALTIHQYWSDYSNYSWNNDLLIGIQRSTEPNLSVKDCSDIATILRAGLVRSPESSDGQRALAKMLHKLGDLGGAVTVASKAAAGQPVHTPFVIALARLHLAQGDLQQAELFAREAVRLSPAYAKAHRILRDVLIARKAWLEAAASAENVTERDSRAWSDIRVHVQCLNRTGQTAKAEAILSGVVERFPDAKDFRSNMVARREEQKSRGINKPPIATSGLNGVQSLH